MRRHALRRLCLLPGDEDDKDLLTVMEVIPTYVEVDVALPVKALGSAGSDGERLQLQL
jgi:hypothetical protein